MGDPYSTAAAKAFESAAIANQIDVCAKPKYESGSSNMRTPIKQIVDHKCCLVTVVFGQTRDITSLLLEAHRQNYIGEWIMGDNVMGSLDSIVSDLNKHLGKRSTHKLLRGMFESTSIDTQLHLILLCFTHKQSLSCIWYLIVCVQAYSH